MTAIVMHFTVSGTSEMIFLYWFPQLYNFHFVYRTDPVFDLPSVCEACLRWSPGYLSRLLDVVNAFPGIYQPCLKICSFYFIHMLSVNSSKFWTLYCCIYIIHPTGRRYLTLLNSSLNFQSAVQYESTFVSKIYAKYCQSLRNLQWWITNLLTACTVFIRVEVLFRIEAPCWFWKEIIFFPTWNLLTVTFCHRLQNLVWKLRWAKWLRMFNVLDLLAHAQLYSCAAPVVYWSFDLLKRGTLQNLVLTPGASLRINTVSGWKIEIFTFYSSCSHADCIKASNG